MKVAEATENANCNFLFFFFFRRALLPLAPGSGEWATIPVSWLKINYYYNYIIIAIWHQVKTLCMAGALPCGPWTFSSGSDENGWGRQIS